MKFGLKTLIALILVALIGSCASPGLTPAKIQTSQFCESVTEIPKTECEALVAFYNSTDGEHWKDNEGWLQTATPCDWY